MDQESKLELTIDTFFLYLLSIILAFATLFLFFLYFATAKTGDSFAGLIFIPFIILFAPMALFLSIVYFIILKIIFRKSHLSRQWKYVLYPLIALAGVIGLDFIHSILPH